MKEHIQVSKNINTKEKKNNPIDYKKSKENIQKIHLEETQDTNTQIDYETSLDWKIDKATQTRKIAALEKERNYIDSIQKWFNREWKNSSISRIKKLWNSFFW